MNEFILTRSKILYVQKKAIKIEMYCLAYDKQRFCKYNYDR